MRRYSCVRPQFWTGSTGRALREAGRDAQVVALYLITCPAGSMTGVFYLPLPTLCHEVGISRQKARAVLARLAQEDFAHYDGATQTIWLPEMARFQIGESLAPTDKQVKGLARELEAVKGSPFVRAFYEKYRAVFHLPEEGPWKGLRSPSEAPSEPLRSQEQEQEPEQEKEHEHEREGNRAPRRAHPKLDEVKSFWSEANLKGLPEAFFNHFEANGWRTRTGPLRNWQAAARNWSLRERDIRAPQRQHHSDDHEQAKQYQKLEEEAESRCKTS